MNKIDSKLNDLKGSLKENVWAFGIIFVFLLVYASISFVNHYLFRTHAFDLGIYSNVIFDYSFFRFNDNSVMHLSFDNVLSDHFSLILFFIAPFRYLFGSWTLLIFQVAAVLFGGFGAYRFILYLTGKKFVAILAMLHFYSIWSIYSALSFDYHNVVLAAMFVPWLIYYFFSKRWRRMWLFFVLIIFCKENMSLWIAFIFIGLLFLKWKDPIHRKVALLGIAIGAVYFVLVMNVFMPALANEGKEYGHLKYNSLGDTKSEIIQTVFSQPKKTFSLLFENPGNSFYDGIKMELHFVVLLAGGIALLYRPQFMIMLIPVYGQKLFHDSYVKWGINAHYSIEFAAILTIAFFYWIYSLKIEEKYKIAFYMIAAIVSFLSTATVLENRTSKWYNKNKNQFYKERHYEQVFDVEKVYDCLELIPKDAKVCAEGNLVPHLAMRDIIYTFPYIRDAEYIALLPNDKRFSPINKKGFLRRVQKLKEEKEFVVVYEDKDFLLFRRIN